VGTHRQKGLDRVPEGSNGASMEKHQRKTIHQITTTSPRAAWAMERILKDPKCAELLRLFLRLQTARRRNTLLRVAAYLAEGPQGQKKGPYNL